VSVESRPRQKNPIFDPFFYPFIRALFRAFFTDPKLGYRLLGIISASKPKASLVTGNCRLFGSSTVLDVHFVPVLCSQHEEARVTYSEGDTQRQALTNVLCLVIES
jgi:hypothetical protein